MSQEETPKERANQDLAAMAALVEAQTRTLEKMRRELIPRVEVDRKIAELLRSRRRAFLIYGSLLAITFATTAFLGLLMVTIFTNSCQQPESLRVERGCEQVFFWHDFPSPTEGPS